jgi:hypothetical protein
MTIGSEFPQQHDKKESNLAHCLFCFVLCFCLGLSLMKGGKLPVSRVLSVSELGPIVGQFFIDDQTSRLRETDGTT